MATAVRANPIAFIIPCHRVIRETSIVGNYRWDPIHKRAIIGLEMPARPSLRTSEADQIKAHAA